MLTFLQQSKIFSLRYVIGSNYIALLQVVNRLNIGNSDSLATAKKSS
jgi:hypothetical protein